MNATDGMRRAGDVALAAAWSALAAGLGGLGVLAMRHFVFEEFVFAPRDVAWMSPVGHLLVFGAVALPFALVALRWPRLVPVRGALVVFILLAMLSVLLRIRSLHPFASLALSAGVAVRLAQVWGGTRWPGVRPWLWRTTVLMLAAGVVWGVGSRAARAVRSRTFARTAARAPAGAPNVMLIVLDTYRAGNLGVYGATRPTSPRLDRLASAGQVFERAVAASSWSLPSHGTLFTGHWPSELTGRWMHPLDEGARSVAEVLRDAGWHTTGFSGNHIYGSWESGLARGFVDYEAYVITLGQILLTVPLLQTPVVQQVRAASSLYEALYVIAHMDLRLPFEPKRVRRRAPDVTMAFLDWQARHRGRPFFAFLNYFDAHDLGELAPRYRRMFDEGREPLDRYDGALVYVDEWFGVLVDSLAARGELDSTLIVVTADHGEQFGEHGLISHGNSLYMAALHVPLIVRLPGPVPAGRVAGEVSLRDVPATILDLVGVRDAGVPGTSLRALWTGGGPVSPAISEVERAIWPDSREPVAKGAMRSIAWDGWHYIRNGDGTEELYRWIEDRAEAHDLARAPEGAAALAEGRARLAVVPGGYTDATPD